MTFQELDNTMDAMPSLDACETLFKDNAQTLRELFYQAVEDTSTETPDIAGERDFAAESALITFLNKFGRQYRNSDDSLPAIQAVLIYFISFFERAKFAYLIKRIAELLPDGLLRSRAAALFKYKDISETSHDYVARFDEIAFALQSVWDEASPTLQRQCEYIAIEYFCSAAAPGDGIGDNNRSRLIALFVGHVSEYPFLVNNRITGLFHLPVDMLEEERTDANIRISEFFYDEAALLLPLQIKASHAAVCAGKGHDHDGCCPLGFSDARIVLAEKYPAEFLNTGYFVKQPLTKDVFIDFDDTTKCMRYLRQYMPLHMPQIEKAVRNTLDQNLLTRKHLHIVDIGGGPGTLYVVLASLLHRGFYPEYTFDITLVEPSRTFHDFLHVITQYVIHPALRFRDMHVCTSEDVPAIMTKHDVDWYFLANIITPIVRGFGSAAKAVGHLCTVINSTRRRQSVCILTLAENTNSVDFIDVCTEFSARGLECRKSPDSSCPGDWLAGCKFYISPRRLTRPMLKYARITIPEESDII